MEGQVNTDQDPASLGWRAGLPDEFKEHDWAKEFSKVGDFFKSALDIKTNYGTLETERNELKGKMANALFKPGENANDEQKAAFYKSLGVPDSADAYEFSGDGNDPKVTEWAKGIFHKANLTPDQAKFIGENWNGFMQGIMTEQEEAEKQAIEQGTAKLKEEWGDKFDENMEFTKRGYKVLSEKIPELEDFLNGVVINDVVAGNHPAMIKLVNLIGQAVGEDFSLPGKTTPKPKEVIGIDYNMNI